jgi:hypothetical protein
LKDTYDIVAISDIQAPSHDVKAVRAVTNFIKDFAPDLLICVGDEADSPEPARWNKGKAMEYGGTLQKGLDTVHAIMSGFRDALGDKPFMLQRSNHGDRIEIYVDKYAPALSSLHNLKYEALLKYADLDIKYSNKDLTRVAPGWMMAHGDEGGSSQIAGGVAMGIARRTGYSIVSGHTHKLGLQHQNTAVNGKMVKNLFGFEVGHLMDLKAASAQYLKTGGANWQQGFGILRVHKGHVFPVPVPILGRKFSVDGQVYSWN